MNDSFVIRDFALLLCCFSFDDWMIVKKGTCFNSVNSADVEIGLFTGFPEHGKKLSKRRRAGNVNWFFACCMLFCNQMMLRSKVISRIAPRFALPQSAPTFGFRGAPPPLLPHVGVGPKPFPPPASKLAVGSGLLTLISSNTETEKKWKVFIGGR